MRPGFIAAIVIILVVVLIFIQARSGKASGLVRVSHLKCKKCGTEFDYKWIPGASLTSVRLGPSRLLRCPACKKWSLFNIVKTEVDPKTHHCDLTLVPS